MLAAAVGLLGLFAWCLLAGEAPPAEEAAADASDAQDLVFFGILRPVLLRLHVRIDGRPFRPAYEAAADDALRSLFRFLDRNGAGALRPAEARGVPSPDLFLPGAGLGGPGNTPFHVAFNFAALDTNGDGTVSPAELAAYYRDFGAGPFQAEQLPLPSPLAAALSKALFDRLDTDHDGKLSRAEMARAAEVLLALDRDEDELVSPEELAPALFAQADGRIVPPQPVQAPSPRGPGFFVPLPGQPSGRLARELLSRYSSRDARAQGSSVHREDLGLDEVAFARLDTNHDGNLDANELSWFCDRPADLEVLIRLGNRAPEEPAIDVVSPGGRVAPLAAQVHRSPEDTLVLALGGTRIELVANLGKTWVVPGGRDAHLQRFQDADVNRDGFLDRAEAASDRYFRSLFDVLDRDGDNRVSREELRAYLDQVQGPQTRALAARASCLISSEGEGLFDLLDRDRDGRLGLREVRAAPGLLAGLEVDEDGNLPRNGVPRTFRVAVGRGRASFRPWGGNVVLVPGHDPASLLADPDRAGPLWFRKMDRNGDGDVSAKEWLGTAEDFRRLDTDGDGLISPAEAERAATLRKAPGGR
jgi:Ca2+-binding EF-hand superfamily protein